MKQTIGILIILFFLSCTNSKKNKVLISDSQQSKNHLKQNVEHQTIFLNLSPKMDLNTFNSRIENNPNLYKNKFILPLDNYKADFIISKDSNKIILSHSNVIEKSINSLNEKKSKQYSDKNKTKKISKFIEIFKNKYGNPKSILPYHKPKKGIYLNVTNGIINEGRKSLFNFGFKLDSYLIFQDSIKTILLGYKNYDKIISSEQEVIDAINRPHKNKEGTLDRIIENALKDSKIQSRNKPFQKFGTELEINYMLNTDFNLIINEIIASKANYIKEKNKYDSILEVKKMKINENKNKI